MKKISRCVFIRGLAVAQAVDPVSVHVGFVVDKVALRQVFLRVLRFSPVNFIQPVLHYKETGKKNYHLHNKVAQ
jgi:hypothetical protein